MKIKRIVGAAVFLAGLVLLLVVSSYLLVPRDNTAAAGMEQTMANGILGEKENTIDVLVLGDSESYSAFSPLKLWEEKGYTSYVCGTASQRLTYSNTMLRRAFEKQKPKVVILETLAIYRKMSLGNMALTEVARRLPVFDYHDRWKSYDLKGLGGGTKYNWTEDYKGYFYSNQVAAAQNTDYMTPTEVSEKIAKGNRAYIQKIKDFSDENGAELLLLSTPSSQNWDYESHNGIQSLADELGCEYIDLNLMNDIINIDWSQDTRDGGDHLNYTGAVKVTHYLAEYLSGKGVLSDHRGDENYAHWNECLAKLNAEAKSTPAEEPNAADGNTKNPAEHLLSDGTRFAYIHKMGAGKLTLDYVEKVETGTQRAKELGITEDDAPDGTFIYNADEKTEFARCDTPNMAQDAV